MRQAQKRSTPNNLQFAVLGLVSNRPDGVHGYKLTDELKALSDDFWETNFGRVYRVLDSLQTDGLVAGSEEQQDNRPTRNVFRITQHGRQTLDDWLLSPVSDSPKPLRDEMSLKLLFLGPERVNEITELVTRQREIYMRKLSELAVRRRKLEAAGMESRVVELVMDGVEMRVRSDLAWLDHIGRKVFFEFLDPTRPAK
jgi:DNA-binding PadR family transcriptional regulator